MLVLPLVHREIPLIADDYVDMEFGTGVVKITPAHDPNDFEVGLRHNLPIINVMTDDAKIVDEYEKYAGMDRYEAREAIVKDLEAEGALVKVEDHDHLIRHIFTGLKISVTGVSPVSSGGAIRFRHFTVMTAEKLS